MSYKLSSLLLPETFEKIPSSCCSFEELPGGLVGKEFACDAEDPASVPGLGRSPGEGHDNPLKYSCLNNSMEAKPGGL